MASISLDYESDLRNRKRGGAYSQLPSSEAGPKVTESDGSGTPLCWAAGLFAFAVLVTFSAFTVSNTIRINKLSHHDDDDDDHHHHGHHAGDTHDLSFIEAEITALAESQANDKGQLLGLLHSIESDVTAHRNGDSNAFSRLTGALTSLRQRTGVTEAQVAQLQAAIAAVIAAKPPTSPPTPKPTPQPTVPVISCPLTCTGSENGVPGCVCQIQNRLNVIESNLSYTLDDLTERILITMWNLGHNGIVFNYFTALAEDLAPDYDKYRQLRTQFFEKLMVTQDQEPLCNNFMHERSGYFTRLERHLDYLHELRAISSNDDVRLLSALETMEFTIHQTLLWKKSSFGNGFFMEDPGLETYSYMHGHDLMPILGWSLTWPENTWYWLYGLPVIVPVLDDVNGNGVQLADYTEREYRITLAHVDSRLQLARNNYEHFKDGIRRGYRITQDGAGEDFIFGLPGQILNWTDTPYYLLDPAGDDALIVLKSQIKTIYEETQRYLNLLLNTYELYKTTTLEEFSPTAFRGDDNLVVRIRSDPRYNETCGMKSMYLADQLEALEDFEISFRFHIDPHAAIHDVYEDFRARSDAAFGPEATPLSFLNVTSDILSLFIPEHTERLVEDRNDEWDKYYRLSDKLTYGLYSQMGMYRVDDIVSGTVHTRDAHDLIVGDSVYIVAPYFDSDHDFNLYQPNAFVNNCFEFTTVPPAFSIGDFVYVRDYGHLDFRPSWARRTTFGDVYDNAAGFNEIDLHTTTFSMPPETANYSYAKYRPVEITNITGGTTLCIGELEGDDITFTESGNLVRIQLAQTPYIVTDVQSAYEFTIDAGSLSTSDNLRIEHTFATTERVCTQLILDQTNEYPETTLRLMYSDVNVDRFLNTPMTLLRYPEYDGAAFGGGVYAFDPVSECRFQIRSSLRWTAQHEVFGHGVNYANNQNADKSLRPPIRRAMALPLTFTEGIPEHVRSITEQVNRDLFDTPSRSIVSFDGTGQGIYYTGSQRFGDIDVGILPGDQVIFFSFANVVARNALRDDIGVAFVNGAEDFLSKVYNVITVTPDVPDTWYITVQDSETGLSPGFAASTDTDNMYLISRRGLNDIEYGLSRIAYGAGTLERIINDIGINYLNFTYTEARTGVYSNGYGRRAQTRSTPAPTQIMTYTYGAIAMENLVDYYRFAVSITQDEFLEDGHVRGFYDAIFLDGSFEFATRLSRVDGFIAQVLGGGPVDSYTVGQENTLSTSQILGVRPQHIDANIKLLAQLNGRILKSAKLQ